MFGAKIVELPKFIKNRHSVLQAIKDMMRAIRFLYNKSQEGAKESNLKIIPLTVTQMIPAYTLVGGQKKRGFGKRKTPRKPTGSQKLKILSAHFEEA